MENKPWPNEAYPTEKIYPPPSPYARFRQSQGLDQRQERSPPPLAQSAQMRIPNLNDWSSEQEALWKTKDPVEVERYYLNTHLNIKKMKKSPRGKPTCLIRKKKEWRNGLANILVNTVDGWQPTHRFPIAPKAAPTKIGIKCNKKEIATTTGTVKTSPKVPSFQITSNNNQEFKDAMWQQITDDEEEEEKDGLLLN